MDSKFDSGQHLEKTDASLVDSTREAMLEEAQSSLRGLHDSFELYSEIVGPRVAALHKEALDDLVRKWGDYAEDEIGLFIRADYVELIAGVRMQNMVQSSVFLRYSKGELKAAIPSQRSAQPKTKAGGCVTWAII